MLLSAQNQQEVYLVCCVFPSGIAHFLYRIFDTFSWISTSSVTGALMLYIIQTGFLTALVCIACVILVRHVKIPETICIT